MSIHDIDLISKQSKLETAIGRIRAYCKGKRVLVAFSGGKDSQACYHLCELASVPFVAQYSITRFEPPELIRFIRANYPNVQFRRAYNKSLVDEIGDSGLPNRWFRWCCDAKHKKTEGFDIAVIGIRWAESARRRARWSMFGYKQDKTAYVCPIVDWTTAEVWEFLNDYCRVPHCSLYDEGFARIGCVCCPLSPSNMRRDALRWPKVANALYLGHCRNWQKALSKGGVTARGKWFRMLDHKTPKAAFEYWLNHGMTILQDADRPDDEPCLFAGSGFSESDGAAQNQEDFT